MVRAPLSRGSTPEVQPVPLEEALDDLIARIRRRADACRLGLEPGRSPHSILHLADVAAAATLPLARSDAAVLERRERLLDAMAVLREHAV
jgi:hypothetical protein